jgi:proton-dependent oligopeptide transporter, POT family
MIALSTDPLLEWNYGVMACIAATGGILFWWNVHKLDAEEEKLNEMTPGNLHKVDPNKINENLVEKAA